MRCHLNGPKGSRAIARMGTWSNRELKLLHVKGASVYDDAVKIRHIVVVGLICISIVAALDFRDSHSGLDDAGCASYERVI
jgi:hypothetical protein